MSAEWKQKMNREKWKLKRETIMDFNRKILLKDPKFPFALDWPGLTGDYVDDDGKKVYVTWEPFFKWVIYGSAEYHMIKYEYDFDAIFAKAGVFRN